MPHREATRDGHDAQVVLDFSSGRSEQLVCMLKAFHVGLRCSIPQQRQSGGQVHTSLGDQLSPPSYRSKLTRFVLIRCVVFSD